MKNHFARESRTIKKIAANAANFCLCLTVACLVIAVAACNIVAPAAYLAGGLPKLDAQYTLRDVPTLVFVDDRRNRIRGSVNWRRIIADTTSQILMDKELVKTTISPQAAMTLATQHERNSKILSMEEIGTMVGATQIIYVEMANFQNSPDGYTPRPTAACYVRVIDLEKHERVFPAPDAQEADGSREVHVVSRPVDPEVFQSRLTKDKVYEGLAAELGQQIALLFYKHEVKDLGGNLKS